MAKEEPEAAGPRETIWEWCYTGEIPGVILIEASGHVLMRPWVGPGLAGAWMRELAVVGEETIWLGKRCWRVDPLDLARKLLAEHDPSLDDGWPPADRWVARPNKK